jgi:hypothetical protein
LVGRDFHPLDSISSFRGTSVNLLPLEPDLSWRNERGAVGQTRTRADMMFTDHGTAGAAVVIAFASLSASACAGPLALTAHADGAFLRATLTNLGRAPIRIHTGTTMNPWDALTLEVDGRPQVFNTSGGDCYRCTPNIVALAPQGSESFKSRGLPCGNHRARAQLDVSRRTSMKGWHGTVTSNFVDIVVPRESWLDIGGSSCPAKSGGHD